MHPRMVAGVRWAIRKLHERSDEMNDQHAKDVLNTAAFHIGVDLSNARKSTPGDPNSE